MIIFKRIHHLAISPKEYAGNGWQMLLMHNFNTHIKLIEYF